MPAVWPYPPQVVLNETLTAPMRRSASAPRTMGVTPVTTTDLQRTFRLRYATVDSAEASGMAGFFDARRGGYEPFTFINPNDDYPYMVRFASDLTVDFFTPGILRTGAEITFVVVSG